MTENIKEQKRFFKILFHPYIIGIFALLIMAVIFVWLLGNIIDARTLRKALENHISYRLGADVAIDNLETDLSLSGSWKIRLRNIKVSNTSPDFGEELFECRKLVFEGSVKDLLTKKWTPKILFKDWELTVGVAENGRTNLSDLFNPQGASPAKWDGWPFSEIFSGKQNIEFEGGSIYIRQGFTNNEIWQAGNLTGHGSYLPANPSEFNGDINIDIKNNDQKNPVSLKLDIEKLKFTEQQINGTWKSEINTANLPLKVISMLSNIPCDPKESPTLSNAYFKLSGNLDNRSTLDVNKVDVSIDKINIGVFGINNTANITATKEKNESGSNWHVSVSSPDYNKNLEATIKYHDNHKTLELEAPYINFSKLSSNPAEGSWEKFILKNVSEIQAKTDKYIVFGLIIENANAKFSLHRKNLKQKKLTGDLAGGKVYLTVKNWVMGGKGWPVELGLNIMDANANRLFSMAGHIISPNIVPAPNDGNISIALLSPAKTELADQIKITPKLRDLILKNKTEDELSIKAALFINNELRFDDPGGSAILNSLWHLPNDLKSLEDKLANSKEKHNDNSLPALRIRDGYLLHTTIPSKLNFSTTGVFDTMELGKITLSQNVNPLTPQITSAISMAPISYKKNDNYKVNLPEFSKDFLECATWVENNGKFRININSNGKEVEKTYINDIKNRWKKTH